MAAAAAAEEEEEEGRVEVMAVLQGSVVASVAVYSYGSLAVYDQVCLLH